MIKITNLKKIGIKISAAIFLTAAILLNPLMSYAADVSVYVDGQLVYDSEPYLIGGVTYVPLDDFAERLPNKEKVAIEANSGDNYINANGRIIYNENAAVMAQNDELFVPIRSLSEVYGSSVEWNSNDYSVYLNSGGEIIENGDLFYSSDEVYWLSRIISAESRGESLKGQIAVGNVILNRVRSEEFPDTIYNVIFDKRFGVQFTPTVNGMLEKEPTIQSVIAAKICLEGYSVSNEIMYFLDPSIATNFWIPNNRPFMINIGCHDFYA